nr:MAG TPA: putative RNA binding protein [Caudoviricetes sp.]
MYNYSCNLIGGVMTSAEMIKLLESLGWKVDRQK